MISLRAQISQNVNYWYEICDVLVPILHSVKFAKCEIYGSTKLACRWQISTVFKCFKNISMNRVLKFECTTLHPPIFFIMVKARFFLLVDLRIQYRTSKKFFSTLESADKIKKIILEIKFNILSTFQKITVGGL